MVIVLARIVYAGATEMANLLVTLRLSSLYM